MSIQSYCYTLSVPKIVNVQAQKSRIAAAVWRLVANQSLDAVSMRTVAAEADISVGQVQHYFATKLDLLYAGIEHSYELIERMIEENAPSQSTSEQALLYTMFTLLLGESATMRDAIRVNLAFAARNAKEARIQELLTAGDAEIIDMARRVIEEAQQAGDISTDLDSESEARALFACVQGLGVQVSVYQYDAAEARRTLLHYLQRLGLNLAP